MALAKSKSVPFIAVCIIMAVYNVIVFVIPFKKNGGFWTGYSFSMLAMILTAGVSFYALGREKLRSKVYGIPLVMVAWRYLIIQLIIGLLQMILPLTPYNIPFQYGIALNTVLLGGCFIGLIAIDAAREGIEFIDEKIKEKVFYIKSLQVNVECLVDKASDESVKKILKDLAETIKYSDPMSNQQLAAIENKIEAKAAALAEAVENAYSDVTKVLCSELKQLFAERNRKCKILK